VVQLSAISSQYHSLAKTLEEERKKQEVPSDLYYMKQTISNACGTVAMIHAVGNNTDKFSLADPSSLKAFLEATKDSSPDVSAKFFGDMTCYLDHLQERAAKLESDDAICGVHDQVAKDGQTRAPNLDDKVEHHFVAFVQKGGKVYELDGRKEGPIAHGDVKDGDFPKVST